MGMFAKRLHKKEQVIRNSASPLESANVRQQEKTERARANRKRLNASRKGNKGNQFRGGQNKKKGRKAPDYSKYLRFNQYMVEELVRQAAINPYTQLMQTFVETAGAL